MTFGAGALVLGASCVALAVGFGWLGTVRARRPVLDPIAVDWLAAHAVPARVAAIVAGLLLCAGGLGWLARSLRPEGRPDLRLDRAVGHELTVAAGALADAVRADAEAVDGVARARARAVGSAERPALRLDVTLRDGADLRRVWPDLDERVLARARESLGLEVLPAAVRLDTGTANRRRGR
ncbi:alkaline shock response membrane anchor protein AmaP [Prauserella shujinwangii]|uniref:alkaline shock response membrane anchor protein AmaP n=1 Tax=Prauserella shujinwangii TaxID=1453103 RepID=UPI000D062E01|nr:alkaline shock response membrane anchor protein AmaP [Prauserella shujinwangii]